MNYYMALPWAIVATVSALGFAVTRWLRRHPSDAAQDWAHRAERHGEGSNAGVDRQKEAT